MKKILFLTAAVLMTNLSAQASLIGYDVEFDYFYQNPFYGNWTSMINGVLLDPPEEQPAPNPVEITTSDEVDYFTSRSGGRFTFSLDFTENGIIIIPTWNDISNLGYPELFNHLLIQITSEDLDLSDLTYRRPQNAPEDSNVSFAFEEDTLTIEMHGILDDIHDNEYRFSSSPVPEPASATILGMGIAFLLMLRRRFI